MKPEDAMAVIRDLPWHKAHLLRGSDKLAAVWSRLPRDDTFYVGLAKTHVSRLPENLIANGTDEVIQEHEVFKTLMRELIYFDGRTMSAALWVAEWVLETPNSPTELGVNALAWIKSAIQRYDFPREVEARLQVFLRRFLHVEQYYHNSSTALNLLRSKS